MNDVVFVLGAGASHHAGVPLMADFLDRARDLLAGGKVDDAKTEFELVFRGITALQGVHSKADVDIHNVESVFSAFEMAKLLGAFGSLTGTDLDGLISAMPTVIARTVEETMRLRVEAKQHPASVLPPQHYIRFADLVKRLLGSTGRSQRHVTILSFNYDIGVDLALNWKSLPFTYGLGGATQPLALLKLHGSIGWFRCECGHVYEYPVSQYPWNRPHLSDFSDVAMKVAELVRNRPSEIHHCSGKKLTGPVVAPPLWNKMGYHTLLSHVWAMAAQRLRTAESVIAIGYSLPQTDAFFRYLYALGSVGDLPLRRFWVFNSDTSGETEARFRSLLGRGAENRFRYYANTFENCIESDQMKTL